MDDPERLARLCVCGHSTINHAVTREATLKQGIRMMIHGKCHACACRSYHPTSQRVVENILTGEHRKAIQGLDY